MSKSKNIYYVYLHRHPETGEVFYVGMGQKDRAWIMGNREHAHKSVTAPLWKKGFLPNDIVEIAHKHLDLDSARRIERELIESLPAEYLTNRAYKNTSEKREDIIKLYKEGHSYNEIMEIVGTYPQVIVDTIHGAGIKPRSQRHYDHTLICRDTLATAFEETGTVREASAIAGCSSTYGGKLLRQMGYETRANKKHDHAKIIKLFSEGNSPKEVADAMNIPYQTSWEVIKKHKNQS